VSYSASVVKIYNAASPFFERKYFLSLRKTLYVAYYNAGVEAVNSKVVRLAHGAL
jgi:hypothetical protein